MKFCKTYCLIVFCWSLTLFGQEIPSSYQVDWTKAGCETPVFSTIQINFVEQQTKFPQLSNNDLIDKIINELGVKGGIIYFPWRSYLFTRTIQLKSNISIKGDSMELTQLIFDNKGKGDLIAMNGAVGKGQTPISGMSRNSNQIQISKEALLVKDVIYLYDNDENLVTNEWARGSTGQLFAVIAIDGNKVVLSNVARKNFSIKNNLRFKIVKPVENCHVSDLLIRRKDRTPIHSSNLFLNYTKNCTVKNIQSYNCSYSHIALEKSLNCSVENSSFNHSLNYGKGGNGYGVVVQFGTSDCKIANNTFTHLRHAMMAQIGANGNVFENNTSDNPFWSGTILPAHSSGDIVLHGNYPYANLFKSNSCQQIVIDNSHGINGEGNSFIDNDVLSYGIYMNKHSGNGMVFVGNRVAKKGLIKGKYKIRGENHCQFENTRKGKNLDE